MQMDAIVILILVLNVNLILNLNLIVNLCVSLIYYENQLVTAAADMEKYRLSSEEKKKGSAPRIPKKKRS